MNNIPTYTYRENIKREKIFKGLGISPKKSQLPFFSFITKE